MYKVLIVDDEPLVQVGIKSMLDCEKLNIEICGIASNGESALELIDSSLPDIVICDIKMPRMTGLELIKICCERYGYGHPVFIFLTSYEEFQMVKEALTYQASDYLIKLELTPSVLEEAIEKAKKRVIRPEVSSSGKEDDTSSHMDYYDKFYIRLLQNMFDNQEQFHLQCRLLNLTFDADAYQCVYLEFFDNTGNNLSPKKQFSLYLSSYNLLKELIVKYIPATVISLDVKHCTLIIELHDDNGRLIPDSSGIMEILNTIQDAMHKYYNITFHAGIGTIETDPLEISTSYQYARQAYSYADDTNPFLSIEGCSQIGSSHQIFNLSIFRKQLLRAFEEFDENVLKETIDELTAIFLQYPNRNFQAMDAACSILYMTISSLPNGEQTVTDLFSDYPDYYRSIYRQHTTSQIITWLDVYKEKVAQYFVERKNSHTNYTVNQVKRYINEHITEKLTLNETASRFGITPNYLSQLFKKYNDIGFNEYITVSKINEAKKLLSEGCMKIYEISEALGFESSFYFSKVFKKYEGISPKDYINQKLS
ncbi:MAG: response regulator [Thermoflexaceae bacterium]|nr:response regulator [Thermoflexaceae bacterium]